MNFRSIASARKAKNDESVADGAIEYVPVRAVDRVDTTAWQMADKDVQLELNVCACLQTWCPWDNPSQELIVLVNRAVLQEP